MSGRTSRWHIVLAVLIVAVALAVAGSWSRRRAPGRCALDGAPIEPLYRVRVVDGHGHSHDFCCVRCAELWLEGQMARPREVHVTDESGGGEVEANRAYFVRSSVVTTATTGNRIHAFKDREDAERHAAAAGGRLLTGTDRPFSDD